VRAFVTGATGFVGGHLVDALLARGDEVTALVRSPDKAKELARRGVRLVVGTLDGTEPLDRAVAGAEVIYHVAGLTAARSEAEFLATNRDGTARLLAAARQVGQARVVLVSSLAAAGPALEGRPLEGNEAPRPVTRYGRSKLAAEDVLKSGSLPWTIIRPPAVYGPADREMFRVFRAASLGVVPVFGDGSQRLSLVFGPDLAAAIAAAGATEATIGGTYYACHPEIITSRQLVETAAAAAGRRVRIIGVPEPLARGILWATDSAARLANRATVLSLDKAAEFFAPAWIADPSGLTRAAGWAAEHSFAQGARRTWEWYRAHAWL